MSSSHGSDVPSTESLAQAHQTLFTSGMAMRRRVAGAKYVDAALANGSSSYARPMQELATEMCWGFVWTRPGLELKTRSLLNVAMLCALNRSAELGVHTRGALNNGASEVEIRETVLQASVYCGMPVGIEGFKVTEKVIKEWKEEHGIEGEVLGDEGKKNREAEELVRDIGVEDRMNLEHI